MAYCDAGRGIHPSPLIDAEWSQAIIVGRRWHHWISTIRDAGTERFITALRDQFAGTGGLEILPSSVVDGAFRRLELGGG
ncbi:hypothetical protein, partial [Rhodovulum sulfidophilum]|uniref:hypothetical protein n=1 Tax=Rhodovulum sulfidophilum TaxID=35806 RepID=UPI001F2DB7E3